MEEQENAARWGSDNEQEISAANNERESRAQTQLDKCFQSLILNWYWTLKLDYISKLCLFFEMR